MVGWTGKDYKYDFDVQGFLRHSVIYFGMAATVFYVIRFAFWMINRVHSSKEAAKQQQQQDHQQQQEKEDKPNDSPDKDSNGDTKDPAAEKGAKEKKDE